MLNDRHAAIAIVIGSVAVLVTMVTHPTGSDVVQNAAAGGSNLLDRGVHLLAIGAQPVLLSGLVALSWRLRASALFASMGLIAYSFALFAVLVAAAASGLMAPAVAERIVLVSAETPTVWRDLFRYTSVINQAFAAVYVALAGMAVVAWSLAMRADRSFPRWLSWFGLVIGTAGMVGIVLGKLHLDIHGFGAVILLQSVWMVGCAARLATSPARG